MLARRLGETAADLLHSVILPALPSILAILLILVVTRRTRADLSGDLHHTLTAKGCRLLKKFFRQLRGIKNCLSAALAVAHVDKNQAAQVPAGVDPTGKRNYLANMRRAQFVAMMRSFHSVWNSKQKSKANADIAERIAGIQRESWRI